MSLLDRIDKIEDKINPKKINHHVIILYPHLTKEECIKEFEAGNKELYPDHLVKSGIKVNLDDPIYWLMLLPDYFKNEHIKWMREHQKIIDNLIHNKGYSLNKVYDEFYEKGF